MKYEEMTVEELRKESRRRNLHLQKAGKKFVKAELIRQLEDYDRDAKKWEGDKPKVKENSVENKKEGRRTFHKETFSGIVNKYKGTVEIEDIKKGDFLVFIDYVTGGSGEIHKKVRSAKVNRISRRDQKVETIMFTGAVRVVCLEDVLYLRKEGENLPIDIRKYMQRNRTNSGRKMFDGYKG